MARPRSKHNPTIPAHIDQAMLPKGIYWDKSGKGRWYVLEQPRRAVTVASAKARLSDLHAIMEARSGRAERGTVGFVMEQFHASTEFGDLAPRTKVDYERQQQIVRNYRTAMGLTLDTLQVARMSTPVVQRIVEQIARGTATEPGKPTKANHLMRYLRRVFAWGIRQGHCTNNPAKGVKQAKERRRSGMPTPEAFARALQFCQDRGCRKPHTMGSVPAYMAPLMYIAYTCRLRGVEALTLTDANHTEAGILSNRRKGSRDNITRWTPGLRQAWAELVAYRRSAMQRNRVPVQARPEARRLVVAEAGRALTKSGLDSAWQRMMALAIEEGALAQEQLFTLHGIKHRGITDSADKTAGGHRTEAMRQRYDHQVPVVEPAEAPEFSGVFSGGGENVASDTA